MKNRNPSLGMLGAKFFSFVQLHELAIVRLGDLQRILNVTPQQEQELLKRLARSGFILRLKRSVYLVPNKIPPGGHWQPDGKYIIAHYMNLYKADFYISGMYAMNYHGLTTQIPNELTIYNNKIYGPKKIGTQRVVFIKIASERMGGLEKIIAKNKMIVYIASLERVVLDAVYDWKKLGALPDAYEWIKERIDNKKFIRELIRLTVSYGNVITKRRIGYCLELFGVDKDMTKLLLKSIKSQTGWVLFNPYGPRKGKTDRKWRVIHNVEEY